MSKKEKKPSNDELIMKAQRLYWSIYKIECYNTRDMILYKDITKELESRGYIVREETTLKIHEMPF